MSNFEIVATNDTENISASQILQRAMSFADLNDSFVNRQNNLPSPSNPSDIIIERLNYLERSLTTLQNETYTYKSQIEDLLTSNEELEKQLNIFQQYNRRENIELSGVPENILQKDLERFVISILRRIGVHNLSSYEIVACHRLKRKMFNENVPRDH